MKLFTVVVAAALVLACTAYEGHHKKHRVLHLHKTKRQVGVRPQMQFMAA